MVSRILRTIALTIVFPGLLSMIVYYEFCTAYTGRVFHEAGFRSQYESGIYKYRVLGRFLLLGTQRFLQSESCLAGVVRRHMPALPAGVRALDEKGDPSFYAAYVLQNSLFLMLSATVLKALLSHSTGRFSLDTSAYMTGVSLMAFSQYVVVPYDNLANFLTLLALLLIVRPFKHSFAVLLIVLVLAALARESAALILSLHYACHFGRYRHLRSRESLQLIVLGAAFLVVYAGLRLALGFDNAVFHRLELVANLSGLFPLIGLASLPIVSYLLCAGSRNGERCLVFMLASSPYVAAVLLVASTREIRLWIPIWIPLMVLARQLPGDVEAQRPGPSTATAAA